MTSQVANVLPEAAMRAAVLKALLDEVKKAYEAARVEADAALLAMHSTIGVRAVEVRLPGSTTPIAQISVGDTVPGLRVDEEALLAYCAQEHPSEVQEVPAQRVVRSTFRKALLARLVTDADGTVVDPQSGRVCDFVTPVPAAPPSTTMTFKAHGRDEVAAGHRAGRLSLRDLLLPEEQQ